MSVASFAGAALRIAAIVFALLYAFALVVWAVGTFGLFGVEPDALSGIYLVVLGLPWTSMFSGESGGAVAGVLAPLINLAVLVGLRRLLG